MIKSSKKIDKFFEKYYYLLLDLEENMGKYLPENFLISIYTYEAASHIMKSFTKAFSEAQKNNCPVYHFKDVHGNDNDELIHLFIGHEKDIINTLQLTIDKLISLQKERERKDQKEFQMSNKKQIAYLKQEIKRLEGLK